MRRVVSILAALMMVFLSGALLLGNAHRASAIGHSETRAISAGTIQGVTQVAQKRRTDPIQARLVDCEDFDVQPCWTVDDGAYRIVMSYKPYRSFKVSLCKAEDGGKKLPCLWRKNNKRSDGIVTRNYFYKTVGSFS